MEFFVTLAIACGIVYLIARRNRESDENAPLRTEIAAGVTLEVPLHRASVLGTGGFGGTRGFWIRLRGPKRLTVGAHGFTVSAPQSSRQFAFTRSDSSLALSRAPSRVVTRDWIVITRLDRDRPLQLAITSDNLPEVWQALAGTGAALAPASGELEPAGTLATLGRITGWRRVALGFGFAIAFAFLPALVLVIARHLPWH